MGLWHRLASKTPRFLTLPNVPGLRGGQNQPPTATLAPVTPAHSVGVTAGFRMNPMPRGSRSAPRENSGLTLAMPEQRDFKAR